MRKPALGPTDWLKNFFVLTHKVQNTTIAEFANTVDPDETAHKFDNEPFHLDYSDCPLVFGFSTKYIFILKVFRKCRRNFVICFFAALQVKISKQHRTECPCAEAELCQMSLVLRKPVFEVSDQVRHKPGCTATEDG